MIADAATLYAPLQQSGLLTVAVVVLTLSLLVCYSGPLAVGISSYFLSMTRSQNPRFKMLFSGFDCFGKSCAVFWATAFLCLLWLLPVGFSWLAFLYSKITPFASESFSGVLFTQILALMLVVGLITLFIFFRHSMILFAFIDNPSAGVLAAIKKGFRLIQKNYGRLFKAWMLLVLLIIGWMIVHMLVVIVLMALGGALGIIAAFTVHFGSGIALSLITQIYSMGFLAAFYDDLATND